MALGAAAAVCGVQILLAGDVKSNIQKLRNPDYGLLSYREYYAIGVMEQVKDFLGEAAGTEPSEYRVVSLGIDPAAALYHGFYCLDGYSNNYPAEYKHDFRRVLAPELERSDYLKIILTGGATDVTCIARNAPGITPLKRAVSIFRSIGWTRRR